MLVALAEADLCWKALHAHQRKEVSPEYLLRQCKKNRPGTNLKVMVNETILMSVRRFEADIELFWMKCRSVPEGGIDVVLSIQAFC